MVEHLVQGRFNLSPQPNIPEVKPPKNTVTIMAGSMIYFMDGHSGDLTEDMKAKRTKQKHNGLFVYKSQHLFSVYYLGHNTLHSKDTLFTAYSRRTRALKP